jgi:hypothetical protein
VTGARGQAQSAAGQARRPWEGLPKAEAEKLKEELAFTLRQAGYSFERIAKECGYADHSGAARAVKRARAHLVSEPLDEQRLLELSRLDELQRAVWTKAMQGEPRAVQLALQIIDRRTMLLGLNAPDRLEVLTIDAIDAEAARLDQLIAQREREAAQGNGHAH